MTNDLKEAFSCFPTVCNTRGIFNHVSFYQGIEALESYIDPSKVPEVNQVTDPALPEVTIQVPDVQTATPAPAATPPKPVICKKGKCAPYDPTKDRVLTF